MTWPPNKNRVVLTLQHRWSKDLWLKTMDSCCESLLSMKWELGISNLSWKSCQAIGSKWWFMHMITVVSWWRIECPVEKASQKLITMIFCKSCVEKCTKTTWLAYRWAFCMTSTSTLEERDDGLAWELWLVNITSSSLQPQT